MFPSFALLTFLLILQSQHVSGQSSSIRGINAREEKHQDNRDLQTVYDVIIIGAGWSGLAAARTLHDQGYQNIKILEARDYVGGRSVTSYEWGADVPVDLGSSWVHGIANNPVQKIVNDEGIPYGMESFSGMLYDGEGKLTDDESNEVTEIFNEFYDYQTEAQNSYNNDVTLRNIANKFIQSEGLSDDLLGKPSFETELESITELDYAADAEDLSLWWWNSDNYLGGGETYLTVENGGYSKAIDAYAEKVMQYVQLDSIVTSIDYSGNRSTVTYKSSQGAFESIKAKKVVVTLPLGVLQNNSVEFNPSLSSTNVGWRKQKAINKMGMGTLDKIVLYWKGMSSNEVFWPKGKQTLMLINPLSDQDTSVSLFYNAYSINGGKPVLVGFVGGDKAKYFESLSDSQVVEKAMESLKTMFGNNIPDPTDSMITRWNQDPYSFGSYAHLPKGSRKRSRNHLAKSIQKKLYFAGEATDSKYPATTHGALRSGITAANEIINSL